VKELKRGTACKHRLGLWKIPLGGITDMVMVARIMQIVGVKTETFGLASNGLVRLKKDGALNVRVTSLPTKLTVPWSTTTQLSTALLVGKSL